MAKNRRSQMPKQRNFVKKNMDKFQRPRTHRDRTKYDRYEDYLKDQLDDLINNESIWGDNYQTAKKKGEFLARLKGEDYDPDQYKNYEEYLDRKIEDWEDWGWD